MMWDYGDDRYRMHDQSGAGWVMVVLMVVVALAVVVAVVALLRGAIPTPTPHAGTAAPRAVDARAILQDRFARGEIDEQDFRARMRALDETGPAGT